MKPQLLLVAISLIFAVIPASADTLILQDSDTGAHTNRITIGTNEAVVIDFIPHPYGDAIYSNGAVSNTVRIHTGSAIAGPCELTFFQGSAVVTFHRIYSPAIRTAVVGADETNTVTVPANQTLKLFGNQASGEVSGEITVTRGTSTRSFPGAVERGCELTGPLTVAMRGYSDTSSDPFAPDSRQLFTYYVNEDFLQVTAKGFLQGPSGSYEVLVEKSNNLTNWSPVMIQPTATAETRAFYRLRIQK